MNGCENYFIIKATSLIELEAESFGNTDAYFFPNWLIWLIMPLINQRCIPMYIHILVLTYMTPADIIKIFEFNNIDIRCNMDNTIQCILF